VGDGSRVCDELALRAGSSAEALGRGRRDLHGGERAGVRGFSRGGGVVVLWALLHRSVAASDLKARFLLALLFRAQPPEGRGAPETMTLRRGSAQARRTDRGPLRSKRRVSGKPSMKGVWVERYRQRAVRVSRGSASEAATAARLSGSGWTEKAT
jgi:hypothetical protein